jgi:O-succinylbenzoic acid--CoA ligase
MLLAHNHLKRYWRGLLCCNVARAFLPVNPQLPHPLLDVLLPQMTLRFSLVLNRAFAGLPALVMREEPGHYSVAWQPERLASMTLTSGSTGLPKAAVRTCAAHLAPVRKAFWR